jgi:predicted ABC-type ATPase
VPAGIPVLDPNATARTLRPDAPDWAATQAEREALRLQREFLERGRSFAVETTCAGTAILCLMEDARHHRFAVQLLYIGIEDVQTAIDRIAVQVTRGGHHIPAIDVRRRYNRSLGHLRAEIERADRVMLIDNTPSRDRARCWRSTMATPPCTPLICRVGSQLLSGAQSGRTTRLNHLTGKEYRLGIDEHQGTIGAAMQ